MAYDQSVFPHAILLPPVTQQHALEPKHGQQKSYSTQTLFQSKPNVLRESILNHYSSTSFTSVLLPGDLQCDMSSLEMLGEWLDMEELDPTPASSAVSITLKSFMDSTVMSVPIASTVSVVSTISVALKSTLPATAAMAPIFTMPSTADTTSKVSKTLTSPLPATAAMAPIFVMPSTTAMAPAASTTLTLPAATAATAFPIDNNKSIWMQGSYNLIAPASDLGFESTQEDSDPFWPTENQTLGHLGSNWLDPEHDAIYKACVEAYNVHLYAAYLAGYNALTTSAAQNLYVSQTFPNYLVPYVPQQAQIDWTNPQSFGNSTAFQSSQNLTLNGMTLVAHGNTNSSGSVDTYISSRESSWASRSTGPSDDFDDGSESSLMITAQEELQLNLELDYGTGRQRIQEYIARYNYWIGSE